MLRVITFNANGIRAAARKGFFGWMEEQRPDIVCIQETKAHEHQLPPEALNLPAYTSAFVDAQKKGYSGVAIYSRRPPLRVTRGFQTMPDMDAEGRFVQMEFGDLTVASLYVPSGTSGPARQAVKYSFLERFIPRLIELKSGPVPVIICGDYNIAHREIDVFDPKACARVTGFLPDERHWFDDVIDRVGWVDAFRLARPERASTRGGRIGPTHSSAISAGASTTNSSRPSCRPVSARQTSIRKLGSPIMRRSRSITTSISLPQRLSRGAPSATPAKQPMSDGRIDWR